MRRLVRPNNGRLLAGVCAGIAQYFHIDASLVRIIFIALLLIGGFPGILLYGILWMAIPEESRIRLFH